MESIKKYPRTQHIEGSKQQFGDEDLNMVPFTEIKNRFLIIEEKMDGANSAISFAPDGSLRLQSRGHYLTGGPREKHFALLKTWANTFVAQLRELLGQRYIMYGEWMYAKHTIFYTRLPHYFLEFDVYDKEQEVFLSTAKRRDLLKFSPFIHSVKILFEGKLNEYDQMIDFVRHSEFIDPDHLQTLRQMAENRQLDGDRVVNETDQSQFMEGLYIKVEENEEVLERYKFVRGDFLATVHNSNSHWLDRPVFANQLETGTDLFNF